MKKSNSKTSKGNKVRVSRATKTPASEQAVATPTPAAATPRAQEQLDEKREAEGKPFDPIVAALNAGKKIAFPKGANAVRVTIGGKTKVELKNNVDTFKGADVETAEFGHVPNDKTGNPDKDKFQAMTAPEKPANAPKAAKAGKGKKAAAKPVEKPANGNPYKTGSKRARVYDIGFDGYRDAAAFAEKVIAGLKCGKAKAERLVKLVTDPKAQHNEGSKEVKAENGLKLVAA